MARAHLYILLVSCPQTYTRTRQSHISDACFLPAQGNGSTSSTWAAAYARARGLVAQLTLEEQSNLTHGVTGPCVGQTGAVPRLNIPELCFADAPDGIRGQEFVSSFPAGIHLGATFDRNLMLKYGSALGREYRGKGIHVALGPFVGPLGRVARGGRNWEGLGADPYLAGVGGAMITKGTQDAGVIATPKVCGDLFQHGRG
jgi:beta-glucosidase